MIRLLDLPGAQALEDRALLHGGPDQVGFDVHLESFCVAQFKTPPVIGQMFADADEHCDDNGDKEYEEEGFDIRVMDLVMAEDIVDYLLTLGFDLRNDGGQPLLITKRIGLTIECVAKGVFGQMPDMEKADAERFGRGLAEMAKKWKSGERG